MTDYPIPDELAEVWDNYVGLCNLRRDCIRHWWGYKRAIKVAKEAETCRRQFWADVARLYPHMPLAGMRYDVMEQAVVPGEVTP